MSDYSGHAMPCGWDRIVALMNERAHQMYGDRIKDAGDLADAEFVGVFRRAVRKWVREQEEGDQ